MQDNNDEWIGLQVVINKLQSCKQCYFVGHQYQHGWSIPIFY